MAADSIFTKIIKGEIPCHKIYEDEQTFAFLDIVPLNPGHTLVIPKQQIEQLWDLESDLYAAVMRTVRKVAERQREVLRPLRVGMALEGLAVAHAHVHVFPLHKGLEPTIAEHLKRKRPQADNKDLAEMAKKLAF